MNRVVCLIQARMNSSRFHGKALVPLAGRPVLEHVVRRMAAARRIDSVVVATSESRESDPIAEWVRRNADAARPKPLDVFRGDERDCLARFCGAAKAFPADIYVRATADNPLVDPELASRLIECLEERRKDYAACGAALSKGLATEAFWRETLEVCGKLKIEKFEREAITYPMYSRPGIFSTCVLEIPEGLRRPDYRLTLDTDEDYALLSRIFDNFGAESEKIDTEEVVRFLDADPKLRALNAHIEQRPAQDIDW